MGKEIRVRIVMRYNSTEGWQALSSGDSVLAKGEIGLEYVSGSALPKMKIGNGASSWENLPYFETSLPKNYTWGDLRGTTLQTTMTKTESLDLDKPGFTDIVNIVNLNKNFDKIDAAYILQSNEMRSLGDRITALTSYTGTDETAIGAELLDARTRADGTTTYSSVGDALRAIDADLQTFKNELDDIIGKSMPSQLILDDEGKLYLADSKGTPISDGILVKDTQLANEVAALRSRFGGAGSYSTAAEAFHAVDAELQDVRVRANGDIANRAGDTVRAIDTELQDLKKELTNTIETRIPDGLSYVNNMLSLMVGGETIGDPVEITGGGGGGQATTYIVSLTNLLDSRVISVAVGSTVILKYNYTSIDSEGVSDGAGSGEITVNGVKVANINVSQGDNELDITQYLGNGENTVNLRVINSEGSYRSLRYTVNVLVLSMTSTFPTMGYYNVDTLAIQYTVSGEGTKKVFFELENQSTHSKETLATELISSSGQSRQFTMSRPANTGSYILKIFAEAGEVVSNTISIGMIWYDNTSTEPFIVINTNQTSTTEGETIKIPYMVFHPTTETPKATFIVLQGGEEYSSQTFTVGRAAATWSIQRYPVGEVEFKITCGLSEASIKMIVEKSAFDREIIENGLLMEFNATGRQNAEDNPAHWEYGDIAATFNNVGWKSIDGWFIRPGEDQTVLRLLPGGSMYIPFFPFKNNIVETGYTIEIELATQNVSDYDSIVVESFSGGRGFIVKSQSTQLSSTNTKVSAQFREDDRVRLTFVVEQNTTNRLVFIYINGVCCGVEQYASVDNFAHPADAIRGLTIGAESCGIDVYFIRFYNLAFTATQQLNNFICDRPSLAERIAVDNKNNIVNENASDIYQSITISSLKNTVPYMIMECPELPQYKGDKKKGMSIVYVNPYKPEKSFTAQNCEFNVQGTSSAIYPVKNFKIKLDTKKEGIVYTQSGERDLEGYHFLDDDLPTKVFCLKANYASSEQANNTMLVDYYNETCPVRTPPQEVDERVRYSIYGEPIVLFWRNTDTNEILYWGMYCMNQDKDNEAVFGFKDVDISSVIPEDQQVIECWEFSNNNTALCLFQDDDMASLVYDAESKADVPRWTKSFERRFPEQEDEFDLNDIMHLQRVMTWVVSTNPDAATGTLLESPFTTSTGTTYNTDTAEYRLAKFKEEFEEYFNLDAMAYYYIYTEVFLLMDSRAKNMFLTTFDGTHWMPFPYDMDSALGINNEGQLTFDYNLEDTDKVDGGNVFTGQESVLWNNFRKTYEVKIMSMYQTLRAQKGSINGSKEFSYNAISTKMNNHQSIWPEVLWNTDTEIKYLQPFYKGSNYLDMAQGDKRTQRNFWLFNAFKYRDSKYMTGEAVTNNILLRLYGIGQIEVTPYSHIYARVQFGNAKDTIQRTTRNTTAIFNMDGITTADDLETHIYSSDRIAKLGDLSALQIGLCDFSKAPKLQEIIVGSEKEGYRNGHLTSFTVGASELLHYINISNCYNLTQTIEVSSCPCLKTFKAKGTAIAGVNFSIGGRLEDFYLPNTITGLVLREQMSLLPNGVNVDGYDNLTYLWIDSTPNVPFYNIITNAPKLENVRLVNINWNTNLTELRSFYNILTAERMGSIDATGKFVSGGGAVATGRAYINEDISEEFLAQLNAAFPNLIIVAKGVAKYFIKYVNYDNTELYHYVAAEGTAAIEPPIENPTRPPSLDEQGEEKAWYIWEGWQSELGIGLPKNITQSFTIVAYYKEQYRMRFYNGETLLYSGKVYREDVPTDPVAAGLVPTPTKMPTAQYSYTYIGWNPLLEAAKAPNDYQVKWEENTNLYVVKIFAGEKQMGDEQNVLYGTSPILPTQDVYKYYKTAEGTYDYYPIYSHTGWDANDDGIEEPEGFIIQPVEYTTEPIIVRALFSSIEPTTLSWEEIVACSEDGTYKTALPIGSQKTIAFTFDGKSYEGIVEVVGHDYDTYAEDGKPAHITFILKDIFFRTAWGNNSSYEWTAPDGTVYSGPTVGGWTEGTGKRHYTNLKNIIFDGDSNILNAAVKNVLKRTDYGYINNGESITNNRAERIWTPSASEMGVLVDDRIRDWQLQCGDGIKTTAYVWFTTNESRIKKFEDDAIQYWTRTTQGTWRFFGVSEKGGPGYSTNNENDIGLRSYDSHGLVFGFCL